MQGFKRTAVFAAGFAVASAAVSLLLAPAAVAGDINPSLQSFGTARALSAYELSAPGLAGGSLETTLAPALQGNFGSPGSPSFASSTLLSSNLALDSGRGLDIASRFTGQAGSADPFLSAVNAPYLALADGSRYSGITFLPASNLRLRAGAAFSSERLDNFNLDPAAPPGPLALTYDASQSQSLLGGLSYDVSSALGFDVTAIASQRSGVPLNLAAADIAPKAATQALGVSGHVDMGNGWVTTASFSEGMSQLDLRDTSGSETLHEQSYSFAIAKHGLFGDDALGLSFSRPAPSLTAGFSGFTASGDLPPLVVAQGLNGSRATESDFQLGYVTNFLDGAVALQTNAAYQTNFEGQPGATSVSLLSRAKIKF
jgi:hypothetical protein